MSLWDINDLIHILIVLIMHFAHIFGVDKIGLNLSSILAAFGGFSLIIKFYEWLRIFEMPSFYIYLIGQTIKEIMIFIVLYITSLFLFGVPMLMLDFYSFEDTPIYDNLSGFSAADVFIN